MSLFALGVGLNDAAAAEFKPTDGITLPSDVALGDGTTAIVDASTDETDQAGVEVVTNFDDFNIIVETQKGLETERVNLEDVAEVIMATETISYSDVQRFLKTLDVESNPDEKGRIVIAGVAAELDERVPLSSYTEQPSTANLEETKRFIKKKVQVNIDRLHQLHNEFFMNRSDTYITRAKALLTAVKAEMEKQEKFAEYALKLLAAAQASNNYLGWLVIQYGEPGERKTRRELHDIRYASISDSNFEDIVTFGSNIDVSIFKALTEFYRTEQGKLFKNTLKSSIADLSIKCSYYQVVANFRSENEGYEPAPSYMDLLTMISLGRIPARLRELSLYIEKTVETITEMKQACAEAKPYSRDGRDYSFSDGIGFVANSIDEICQAARFLTMVETFTGNLYPIFETMNEVLTQQ